MEHINGEFLKLHGKGEVEVVDSDGSIVKLDLDGCIAIIDNNNYYVRSKDSSDIIHFKNYTDLMALAFESVGPKLENNLLEYYSISKGHANGIVNNTSEITLEQTLSNAINQIESKEERFILETLHRAIMEWATYNLFNRGINGELTDEEIAVILGYNYNDFGGYNHLKIDNMLGSIYLVDGERRFILDDPSRWTGVNIDLYKVSIEKYIKKCEEWLTQREAKVMV